jgi:hypothetical protein
VKPGDYKAGYMMAAGRLRNVAAMLHKVLDPADVYGLFFAVGIEQLLTHEPDTRAAQWLRELADDIEAAEGGESKWGNA